MFSFSKYFRILVFSLTAAIAGIFLSITVLSYQVNETAMSSNFHKKLFEKNNIYSQVHSVLKNSMSEFKKNLKNFEGHDNLKHADVIAIIENLVTPDRVTMNLDSIREDIFKYFRGDRSFLPDIYVGSELKSVGGGIETNSKTLSTSVPSIKKVNLNVILLYINRTDIIDVLLMLKMFYYVFKILPAFSLLSILLLSFTGLVFCKNFSDILKWLRHMLFSCGMICFAAGATILSYTHFVVPKNIYPLTMSIPLQTDIILSYINDCTMPIWSFALGTGLVFILLSIFLYLLPKVFTSLLPNFHTITAEKVQYANKSYKYTVYIVLFVFISAAFSYKVYAFKKDFDSNNFSEVISKFTDRHTTTQVVSAKNDTIYNLQVKLLEDKTDVPVKNVKINVTGNSVIQARSFHETKMTDETGTVKFTLDKGNFSLNFLSAYFPQDYQMPFPHFFELSKAGTTIITINLVQAAEEEPDWGIAEIEVLDKENKPVEGIELSLLGTIAAPGSPDTVSTLTNSEGIGIFKVNEGTYQADFAGAKFPVDYIQPPSFEISVTPNSVTRYTLRLVDNPQNQKNSPSPSVTPSITPQNP